MNALTAFKAAGLPAVDMSKFKSALGSAALAARAAAQGGPPFLRLLRNGVWVYGADNVEVQEGSLWAINPTSMQMGFCAWGDEKGQHKGKLLGEVMKLITDVPPVTQADLPNVVEDTWTAQVAFDLLCLNGEDAGTLVRYKVSSVGGRRAFAGLLSEVSQHADGDGLIVPVVVLLVDSYQNKTWGKTFVPVFEVKEWKAIDDASFAAPDTETAEQAQADAPAEPERPAAPPPAATAAAPKAETATPRHRRGPVTDVNEQPAQSAQPARPAAAPGTVRRRRAAV